MENTKYNVGIGILDCFFAIFHRKRFSVQRCRRCNLTCAPRRLDADSFIGICARFNRNTYIFRWTDCNILIRNNVLRLIKPNKTFYLSLRLQPFCLYHLLPSRHAHPHNGYSEMIGAEKKLLNLYLFSIDEQSFVYGYWAHRFKLPTRDEDEGKRRCCSTRYFHDFLFSPFVLIYFMVRWLGI